MQSVEVRLRDLPVFVWCSGQDDNIGDVVLRRRLLAELHAYGPARIFLGEAASPSFIDALCLRPSDQVFHSAAEWRAAAHRAATDGPVLCVGKPGEMATDMKELRRALRRLLLHRLVIRSGGIVVQLGIGARRQPGRLLPLFRLAFHYHQLVRWRDPRSQAEFGLGGVMPDWGFDDFGSTGRPPALRVARRPLVAISLRGDRPMPGTAWLDGVAAFCRQSSLRPLVVTQVRRDQERGRALAAALDAEILDWNGETHVEQEDRLRDAYARCALVVSDRLHVLIVGFTEGAVPICLLDRAEDKIGRHFDAIGYMGSSVDATQDGAAEIAAHLHAALRRTVDIQDARTNASAMIAQVGRDLHGLVSRHVPA